MINIIKLPVLNDAAFVVEEAFHLGAAHELHPILVQEVDLGVKLRSVVKLGADGEQKNNVVLFQRLPFVAHLLA